VEVSAHLHAPAALPLGKEPGNQTPAVHLLAGKVTILAKLSQLICDAYKNVFQIDYVTPEK
jgi:hypothetical protein